MDHRRFLKHFIPATAFLRAYLLAATGRPSEAEDLLQEVSSVLWEKFDRYDEARPFRAWATGVARLEVLKWRQKHARDRLVLSEEAVSLLADAALEASDLAAERAAHLPGCLAQLGEGAREIVALRYSEGLKVQDVAARLGRSTAAVEMTLTRTRRALKECVDRKLSGEARS